MSAKSEAYVAEKQQAIVNNLIEAIENAPLAWERGWCVKAGEPPINAVTNEVYHGINALQLSITAIKKGYSDPRWVTFKQADELGARIKAGEHATPGIFWQLYDRATKKEFDKETVKDMTDEEEKEYRKKNVYKVSKIFNVYNAEQCVNMPERKNVPAKDPTTDDEERERQNAIAENIIANSEAKVFYDGGNDAFYSPATDTIHIPRVVDFNTKQDYYATALHEIAHSTGHKSRLDRPMMDRFGTPGYAQEELRAELASVFIQLDCGISIEGKHFVNHAAYLQSWLKKVKNDPDELFSAARDAQKISTYVAEHYMKNTANKAPAQTDDFYILNTAYNTADIDFARQVSPKWLCDAYPEKSEQEIKDAFIKYGAELTKETASGGEAIVFTDKFIANYKAERERRLSNGEKINEETLNSNVKEWYKKAHPYDELGDEINDELTFKDIGEFKEVAKKSGDEQGFEILISFDERGNVVPGTGYTLDDLIDVGDSIVRERCENKFYEVEEQDKAIKAYADAHPQKTETVQAAVPTEKKPFAVQSENIPTELKNLPNWYAVRIDKTPDGRLSKIPISPHQSGYCSDAKYLKHGKPGDTSTCGTYAEAEALAKKWGLPGVGMDLTNSGYAFVDIDHCLVKGDGIEFADNNAGKLAQKVLPQSKNLYVEKSVSGTGLHIIYKGSRPQDRGNRNEEHGLEVYDNARFAAFTGNSPVGVTSIGEPTPTLQAILSDALKPAAKQQTSSTVHSSVLNQSDAEVIERIKNGKRGDEFKKLYNGKCLHFHADGTPDQSRSDLLLCSIVAFYTRADAAQTERIFRSSAAFRPEKGNDYVTRTVGKACGSITQQIKPPKPSQGGK